MPEVRDWATADPPQIPQQLVHETVQPGATPSEQARIINDCPEDSSHFEYAGLSDATQLDAASGEKAGEGTRTLNIQLGRLTLYQLSYARKVVPIVASERVAPKPMVLANGRSWTFPVRPMGRRRLAHLQWMTLRTGHMLSQ